VGYAFVDDTDVIQSVLAENPLQAQQQLQEAINTWESSLKATCGALVPEKTVWWLVSFVWNGSSWQYATIQDSPGQLQVNDISDHRKTIKRLETHEAYETLGVFLAPDGNSHAQFEKMCKAVVTWVDSLRTGNISRDEVWLALQSTILRTLNYPLPALRLTNTQCEAIMAPLLQYCLPALGICRNFPRLLVFSPLDHMGLNILHLHTLQEIVRLKDMIFHSINGTLTGLLYTSSLELLLLELGCSSAYNWYCDLIDTLSTASLVKDTWKFLVSHKILLKHNIDLTPPRQGDQFIMEAILACDPPLQEIVACNHCRMYLRALFVSDIASGDGNFILDQFWNGIPYITPHKKKSWPHYGKPPRKSWDTWKKWLKRALLGRGRRLSSPLGEWLKQDNNWPWYLSQDGGLYRRDSGKWYSYNPVIQRNRLPTFGNCGKLCDAPANLYRAMIYQKGERIVCTGSARIRESPLPKPASFGDALLMDRVFPGAYTIYAFKMRPDFATH